MSFSHSRFVRYTAGTAIIGEGEAAVTGDGEVAFDGTVAPSTTQEIDIAIDKDNLKSFVAFCSGGGLTLKTNSSTVPDDTLTLPAGLTTWTEGDVFSDGQSAAAPFTADVTKLYAVNASGTVTVALKIRALVDVTP